VAQAGLGRRHKESSVARKPERVFAGTHASSAVLGDLVICILWKRLGSPLSVKHQRPGGGRWNSGTEFELVTALEAKKKRGVPDIFIFKNDTEPLFDAKNLEKTRADLDQLEKLRNFITDWCEGVQEGQRVFKAAVNRYQALDQFEQVLEKLLVGKLDERFPPAPDLFRGWDCLLHGDQSRC